nr:unnamed protein product [Spirometra erinaceieuropaei]
MSSLVSKAFDPQPQHSTPSNMPTISTNIPRTDRPRWTPPGLRQQQPDNSAGCFHKRPYRHHPHQLLRRPRQHPSTSPPVTTFLIPRRLSRRPHHFYNLCHSTRDGDFDNDYYLFNATTGENTHDVDHHIHRIHPQNKWCRLDPSLSSFRSHIHLARQPDWSPASSSHSDWQTSAWSTDMRPLRPLQLLTPPMRTQSRHRPTRPHAHP